MPKHTPAEKAKNKAKAKSKAKSKTKRTVKRTTSKDVPGSGLAKKAAKAIEKRRKLLESI